MTRVRRIKIRGTGNYLPKRKVLGTDIDWKLGLEPGTSARISGVEQRYYVENETASQMAAIACERALEDAGLSFKDIDAVISASGSMEQAIPCNGALIQKALGQENSGTPCFDINSTCLSFVTALDTISYLIEAGRFQKVLIVSSEIASVGLNWDQLEACSLFGDGAVAMVVEKTPEGENSALLAAYMETYSSASDACEIRGGGSKYHPRHHSAETAKEFLFHMDGRRVFKIVSQVLPEFMDKLLKPADLNLEDLRLVIPHQASASAMHLMRKKLGISEDRWVSIIADYGNMIAASIPMALHLSIREGRMRRGEKTLLVGTSAGLSIGGVVLEY